MLLTGSASLCAAARDLWEWDGVSAGVEAEADACFELRARRLPLRLSLPFPLALLLLVLLDALQHALGTLLLALLVPALKRCLYLCILDTAREGVGEAGPCWRQRRRWW